MKITQHLLQTIYDRSREVCQAKYNIDPDDIEINCEGEILCKYTPSYSYADEETYTIEFEELNTVDLDYIIADRKDREQKELQKRIKQQQEDTIKREKVLKEERKQLFLKLKKEFE